MAHEVSADTVVKGTPVSYMPIGTIVSLTDVPGHQDLVGAYAVVAFTGLVVLNEPNCTWSPIPQRILGVALEEGSIVTITVGKG